MVSYIEKQANSGTQHQHFLTIMPIASVAEPRFIGVESARQSPIKYELSEINQRRFIS